MAICNPADFRLLAGGGRRLLGLDLGTKTIGLALSDTRFAIASPLATLRRARFRDDVTRLAALIGRHGVAGLVIGLPVALDGSEGPRCQSVRQFARNLLEIAEISVAFWDERMSTMAVNRMLVDELDMTRARRAEVVDRAAAAYILQGALDRLSRLQP